MKLILLVTGILFSSQGFASQNEFVEIVYKRASAPIELTMGSRGTVHITCVEESKPFNAGYETFVDNTKTIAAIPADGAVDAANEDCENPHHEELWLTRLDGSSFLAYQKTCLDNESEEDSFSNGGRIYYTGDAEIDEEIRDSVGNFWVKMTTWVELNSLFNWCKELQTK